LILGKNSSEVSEAEQDEYKAYLMGALVEASSKGVSALAAWL